MSKNIQQYENVKFRKEVVEKIRKHKAKTGISIMAFAEKAILEKLNAIKLLEAVKQSQ